MRRRRRLACASDRRLKSNIIAEYVRMGLFGFHHLLLDRRKDAIAAYARHSDTHKRRTPEYGTSINPSFGHGRLVKAANFPISRIIAGASSGRGDVQSCQFSATL
jgi:hypothetical protein